MKNTVDECTLIMSVIPSARGFGFAFFDGMWNPIDWGFRAVSGEKNAGTCAHVEAFIERYRPDVLVVENCSINSLTKTRKRSPRVKQLLTELEALGHKRKVLVATYSREQIRECFAQFGSTSRYEIAKAISQNLPEFTVQLPPPRKLWLPESNRMKFFDAVSLIFTHFYFMAIKPNTKMESTGKK